MMEKHNFCQLWGAVVPSSKVEIVIVQVMGWGAVLPQVSVQVISSKSS